MALTPLAAAADLAARGIDITDTPRRDALLTAASDAVRDAAGCPISRETSTVMLEAPDGPWLALPGPVLSVTSAQVDGIAVEGWQAVGGQLWRRDGWRTNCHLPSLVTVTFTHGYDPVPADIIDLVCALVAAGASAADGGYAAHNGLTQVRIDDAAEGYTTGEDATTGPMELPPPTRKWLRQRFTGGVATTGVR